MDTRKTKEIPVEMEEVRQQLESWRSAQAHRSRKPETVWASAVKMVRQYGLYRTARALRLDYGRLKKVVGTERAGEVKSVPEFVELLAPAAGRLPECVVELENARGEKMRIHLRGVVPDVVLLSRAFWSSKA